MGVYPAAGVPAWALPIGAVARAPGLPTVGSLAKAAKGCWCTLQAVLLPPAGLPVRAASTQPWRREPWLRLVGRRQGKGRAKSWFEGLNWRGRRHWVLRMLPVDVLRSLPCMHFAVARLLFCWLASVGMALGNGRSDGTQPAWRPSRFPCSCAQPLCTICTRNWARRYRACRSAVEGAARSAGAAWPVASAAATPAVAATVAVSATAAAAATAFCHAVYAGAHGVWLSP